VRGIPLELIVGMGLCKPDDVEIKPHNPIFRNTEQFKILCDKLLTAERNHLRTWFHSFVCDVVVKGDRIDEVHVASKNGLVRIRPKEVIDCTGDGDVAAWAGAPFEKNDPLMPLTMHFRIANIVRNDELKRNCAAQLAAAHEAGELQLYYGPGLNWAF